MEAIGIQALTVAYEEKLIIENLNLSLPQGKISVIIGGNGCGKSTLLKTIARVNKAIKGNIFLQGKDISTLREKDIAKKIAFLPQGPICPNGLTVKELVAYGRFPHQKMLGGLNKHDQEMIDWAIDRTKLTEFRDRKVENLSGGQRQRAWIAMVLAQETEIIMLDEPTTYLDLSYQLEVLEILYQLNKEKKTTVIIVLHEINHAFKFAEHIVGLKKGKVICEGKPIEVIDEKVLREIYGIEAELTQSRTGDYPICMEYTLRH